MSCPYCGGFVKLDVLNNRGVCLSCRAVVQVTLFDYGSGERHVKSGTVTTHYGPPSRYGVLPTTIDTTRDSGGRAVSIPERERFEALNRLHRVAVEGKELRLVILEGRVEALANKLGFPSGCLSEARALVGGASRFLDLHMDSVALALLVIGCRRRGIPTPPLRALIRASGAKSWVVYRVLSIGPTLRESVNALLDSAVNYLPRQGGIALVARAKGYLNMLRGLRGSPKGIAAALLYLAAKDLSVSISKKALCGLMGASESSMSRALRLISRKLGRPRGD